MFLKVFLISIVSFYFSLCSYGVYTAIYYPSPDHSNLQQTLIELSIKNNILMGIE